MSKLEDNTKRRSNEVEEQSVTPRPPKKRFLSRASSPDEDTEDNEDSNDSFKEPLEAFRKDAISRQWKDYIRAVERLKTYIDQAEIKKVESQEHLKLWEDSFQKLQTFLCNIIQEGMSSLGQSSNAMEIDQVSTKKLLQENWAQEFAPNMLKAFNSKDYHELTVSKLNQLIESWISKRDSITTGFQSVFEEGSLKEIQKDHERILSAWVKGQRSLQDMKNRYKMTNFKYLVLSEELRILNDQLELTETNLRRAQSELEKIQTQSSVKNEDSTMTEAAASMSKPTNSETSTADAITAAAASASTGAGTGTGSTSSSAASALAAIPASSINTTVDGAPVVVNSHGVTQDPLIHAQQLLEQRLRDINMIKEDRIGLKQQIARLEMDLICVPESRIYKAPICRQLSQSRAYNKDKCNRLSDICHDLQNALEDLQANRRRLIKELDAEQVNHSGKLQEELKKLDEDLTRIRGQRDALQMSLEERKAATEAGRASIAELKVIADTRKERVNYLETEVLRLQKKMAARTGVKEYYDLLMNSDGREPLLLPLQNELKALEEQVQAAKNVCINQANIPQETVESELAQISKLKQLELDVTKFEEKYGFHPSADVDDSQVQQVLQDRIDTEKAMIAKSVQKISNLEATEKQLLGEIENVAKAYGDLEEENMARVKALAAAEDEIIKLQTERVKYSQTFTALNKSKDAHAMVANALNKQNEKQLAHIKQLNEREKNLNNQLVTSNYYLKCMVCVLIYHLYRLAWNVNLPPVTMFTMSIKQRVTKPS
ncbi:E3 ubiquitin-protein ligase bre1, variant 2 [Mucor circinelloides]